MKRNILIAALAIATAVTSCKKDDNSNSNPSVVISSTQTLKLSFSPSQLYTLFKFSDSSIHTSVDSATSNWDFGFIQKSYVPNMFVNSYASGPGNAGVSIQQSLFASVTAAPNTGYAYDTSATQRAVKSSDWYNYDPNTHLPVLVTPRTFVFKTADGGHYAKVELLNVGYLHLIGSGAAMMPDTLTYKFRYTYQANGSTTF